MTTAQFVSNVVLLSEGKTPSFATGSTKWLRIVAQGNFFLQQWARERGVDWYSLYDPALSIGTVTATGTYDLDDTISKVSPQEGDAIRITHIDDTYTDYTLVSADRLKEYTSGNYVAKIGRTIRFNKVFSSIDPQFDGDITVPAFVYPETFSADADEVVIDDPNWLVFTVAADRVKNDVTRKDLRADLVAQANESMLGLREDNDSQVNEPLRDNFFVPVNNDIFGGE